MRSDPSAEVLAWLDRRPARELFLTAVTEAEVRTRIAFLPDTSLQSAPSRRPPLYVARCGTRRRSGGSFPLAASRGGLDFRPGLDDAAGGARGFRVHAQGVFGREVQVYLDAQAGGQAERGNLGQACVAELWVVDLAESEQGVAVRIEFAEQPGAETAGIEESNDGHVVPIAVAAVGEELLALYIGQQFHGASSR